MNEYLVSSFRQQLKADPTSRVFLRLAEELRKGGVYADAVSVCEDGLTHHPRYVPALVCLGRCQKRLGQLDAAEKVFRQVLDMTADNSHALRGLSDILFERGAYSEAVPFLETLSLVEPNEDTQARLQQAKTCLIEKTEDAEPQSVEPNNVEVPLDVPPPVVSDESHLKQPDMNQMEMDPAEASTNLEDLDQTVVHEDTSDAVANAMAEFEFAVGETSADSSPVDDTRAEEVPPFDFDLGSGPVAVSTSLTEDSNDSLAPPVMDEDSELIDSDMPMLELAADDLEDLDDFHVEADMEIDAIDFGEDEAKPEAALSDWDGEEPHATVAVDPQALQSINAAPKAPESPSFEVGDDSSQAIPDIDDAAELPEISLDDLEDLPDIPDGPLAEASVKPTPENSEAATGNIDDIDREFERAIHEVDDAAPTIFGEIDSGSVETEPSTSDLAFEEPTRDTLRDHVLLSAKACEDYLVQLESDDAVLTVGLKHEKMEHYEEAFKLYRFLMGRNPDDARYREHAERVSQQIEQEDKQRRKIRLLSNWHDKLRGGFHVS